MLRKSMCLSCVTVVSRIGFGRGNEGVLLRVCISVKNRLLRWGSGEGGGDEEEERAAPVGVFKPMLLGTRAIKDSK